MQKEKKKNNNLKPLLKFQNSFALRVLHGRTIHKDTVCGDKLGKTRRSSLSLPCVTCRRQNTKGHFDILTCFPSKNLFLPFFCIEGTKTRAQLTQQKNIHACLQLLHTHACTDCLPRSANNYRIFKAFQHLHGYFKEKKKKL